MILITGGIGQLGSEFVRAFSKLNVKYVALSKKELDISKISDVLKIVKDIKPNIIINCAAYNLVDKAETNSYEAYKVNTLGVFNLVTACMEYNIFLVHFSTDYVFDGKKEGLYVESDPTNPLNEYGKSKLYGENIIKEHLERFLIFRTSWVYGRGKQNFLYKLQEWAESKEMLRIACDEFSVPTSTKTIVEATIRAIDGGLTGLYHLVNCGYASRYEWAKEFFRLKGIRKAIFPAYQQEFNLLAKRPRWSAMSNELLSKTLGVEFKEWQEELSIMIKGGLI